MGNKIYGEQRKKAFDEMLTLSKSLVKWYSLTECDTFIKEQISSDKENWFKKKARAIERIKAAENKIKNELAIVGMEIPSYNSSPTQPIRVAKSDVFSLSMSPAWLKAHQHLIDFARYLVLVDTDEDLVNLVDTYKAKILALKKPQSEEKPDDRED